jgi:hypothetical protein
MKYIVSAIITISALALRPPAADAMSWPSSPTTGSTPSSSAWRSRCLACLRWGADWYRVVVCGIRKRLSSTLGGLAGSRKPPPLPMNPQDAAQRSLAHGIDVRLWNDRGEVILPLQVTDDVPPGVVASEKGAWLSTSRTGQTISALVSADLRADLGEGACFNDTQVEVSRA